MRIVAALILAAIASGVSAKLPPPTEEAKTMAAETAARASWSDKVALYQLCAAGDRVAAAYRNSLAASGKSAPAPVPTPPCVDPGPYVSQITPTANKPLEAAGAHSPPGTAVSPPSTTATANELTGDRKK